MQENNKKIYSDLDELVFEHRNKSYGAFDLRRTYKSSIWKAFFIGAILFLALILIPLAYTSMASDDAKIDETEVSVDLLETIEPPKEEEEEEKEEEVFEQPKEEPVQSIQDLAQLVDDDLPEQATVQNLDPTPTENAKNETPAASTDDLKDKAIGTQNKEGVANAGYQGDQRKDGVEGGMGNQSKKEDVKIVENKVDTNVVHESVDEEAQFMNGGIDGFRSKVQDNFDIEAVEGEGILNTVVTFEVDVNGNISNIKSRGSNRDFNREAERAVRSVRGKWKPGKVKGQNVKSRYSFPLKMRFE